MSNARRATALRGGDGVFEPLGYPYVAVATVALRRGVFATGFLKPSFDLLLPMLLSRNFPDVEVHIGAADLACVAEGEQIGENIAFAPFAVELQEYLGAKWNIAPEPIRCPHQVDLLR